MQHPHSQDTCVAAAGTQHSGGTDSTVLPEVGQEMPELVSQDDSDDDTPIDQGDSEESDEDTLQEDAVLLVMEITSLHRSQAIDLLQQHGGDAHLVLEAVFG